MKVKNILIVTALYLVTAAQQAGAAPFNLTIGDNDGYGFGVSDNGTAVWPGPGLSGSSYDGRSAAEAAASNGEQLTDVYSAVFPAFGPNPSVGSVLFPYLGDPELGDAHD